MKQKWCVDCGEEVIRPKGKRGALPNRCPTCRTAKLEGTCVDCGVVVIRTGGGPLSPRCPEHRKARKLKMQNATAKANQLPNAPPPAQWRNGFELEPTTYSRYTPEQIDTCLALYIRLGDTKRVRDWVKEQKGWEVSETTINEWRRFRYPNRYASLFVEFQPVAQAQMIQNASDEVVALANTAQSIREKLDEEFGDLKTSELPGALKAVAVAQAVQTDKMLLLSGQPTSRVETSTSDDVLRRLEAGGFAKRRVEDSIEGTAAEVQPGAL